MIDSLPLILLVSLHPSEIIFPDFTHTHTHTHTHYVMLINWFFGFIKMYETYFYIKMYIAQLPIFPFSYKNLTSLW